jgi:hypothetical protein
MSRHWSILFTSASSTLSQSTKRRIFICKASTQTSTNAITSIVRTSITSSIDNIVVNRSIIMTIVNSWLILVLAIDSRFVFLKSALYVINQIADQSITRKKKRENSKKRFANRNSKWKTHSKFQRRLKQFITEIEDNQRDDFTA